MDKFTGTKFNMDQLTELAKKNIESNLGSVVDADSDIEEIAEEVFILAHDAVLDAGATEGLAGIIAGFMRTQFGGA